MGNNTLHFKDLGVCEICGNCIEKRHPWYYCENDNDNFGDIRYPKECDDYEECDDYIEDDDDDDVNFDHTNSIDCPVCGMDADWAGGNYECEQCGWCGMPNDE